MTLCACGGIIEIGYLLVASLVFVFPFLGRYFRRNKCEHKHNHRMKYVTSTDLVKMEKRSKPNE